MKAHQQVLNDTAKAMAKQFCQTCGHEWKSHHDSGRCMHMHCDCRKFRKPRMAVKSLGGGMYSVTVLPPRPTWRELLIVLVLFITIVAALAAVAFIAIAAIAAWSKP